MGLKLSPKLKIFYGSLRCWWHIPYVTYVNRQKVLGPSLRIGWEAAVSCCNDKVWMNDRATATNLEMNNPLPCIRISSMTTNDSINTPWRTRATWCKVFEYVKNVVSCRVIAWPGIKGLSVLALLVRSQVLWHLLSIWNSMHVSQWFKKCVIFVIYFKYNI